VTHRRLAISAEPLTARHDVALVDLDGVVYRGPDPIAGAVDHLAAAGAAGMQLGYVTNNASRPPRAVAEHLRGLGIDLRDQDVVTSAQAAARLVAAEVPAGSQVLVIGGPGLVEALAEHDLLACSSLDDAPAAVVQGFHRSVGWELLAEGAYAVAAGLPWVASNLDRTVPTSRGIAPGNGTLVAVIQAVTGVEPVVAGKPEPALVRESVLRTGADRPLMVGDRLDTDISGASRYPMPSLLVLTGVTSLSDVLAAEGDERPDFVAADLAGLLARHPDVMSAGADAATCCGWTARVDDGQLRLRPSVPGDAPVDAPVDAPDAPVDSPGAGVAALRAVVAAGWAARDSGAAEVGLGSVAQQLDELASAPP